MRMGFLCLSDVKSSLIFFDDGVEFDEFSLVILAIVDQFGGLLTDCLYVVKAGQRHVSIEVGGGGTWMYGEYLNRCVALLELYRHHAHHGILCCLACHVSQWMPVGTDFGGDGHVDDPSVVLCQEWQQCLGEGEGADEVHIKRLLDVAEFCVQTVHTHVARDAGIVHE